MNDEDIIEVADGVQKLSQSQTDRMNIKEAVETNLYTFLNVSIRESIAEDTLKTKIKNKLVDRLEPSNADEDPLSDGNLIKLLEILNKRETDSKLGILSVLKERTKVDINIGKTDNTSGGDNLDDIDEFQLTKDEMRKAKKLIKATDFLDSIEGTELNDGGK